VLMDRTRVSLFYLIGYTLGGGVVFAPRTMLKLFSATGDYTDLMVRLVGLMRVAIGMTVTKIVRYRIDRLYPSTLLVWAVILVALAVFYTDVWGPADAGPLFHCRVRRGLHPFWVSRRPERTRENH